MYEILKSLHIICVVAWFAGLFYLPRLYVYHAQTKDQASCDQFKLMEHKLFHLIMTPSMFFTLVFGVWLWQGFGVTGGWIHAKVSLVVLLLVYHFFCYRFLLQFKEDQNTHSHKFYRVFNEVPIILLIGIVFLVVLKPF